MTKSTKPKIAAGKSRDPQRKIDLEAGAETARDSHREIAAKKARGSRREASSKISPETARDTHRKVAPKVAAEKPRDIHREIAPKVAAETPRHRHRKLAPEAAAEKAREKHREIAPKVAADKFGDAHCKIATQFGEFRATQLPDSTPLADTTVTHQIEESHAPQVPDSMRALAERSVAQTRELYGRSANALKGVLESWERSLDAAGQGAVALNRKIIDIAERNINTGFDLATSLAEAQNLAEALGVQAAYWRKQFGELKMQAEEVRALSTKVTADVIEPINAQVTRDIASTKRTRST